MAEVEDEQLQVKLTEDGNDEADWSDVDTEDDKGDIETKDDKGDIETKDDKQSDGSIEDEDTKNLVDNNNYQKFEPLIFNNETLKIEIKNLSKFYTCQRVRNMMISRLKLDVYKVKASGKGDNTAYASFKTEAALLKAMSVMNNFEWKSKILTVCRAPPVPVSNATDACCSYNTMPIRCTSDDEDNMSFKKKLYKFTSPLAYIAPDLQSATKKKLVIDLLRSLSAIVYESNIDIQEFVEFNVLRRDGMICEMADIVEPIEKLAFLAKTELTIGYHPTTKEVTIGYSFCSYQTASFSVFNIEKSKIISPKVKHLATIFSKHIVASSLLPFDFYTNTGFWKKIVCKTTATGDLLLIVFINSAKSSEYQLSEEKSKLVHFFSEGEGVEAKVTSLYTHQCNGWDEEEGWEQTSEYLWGNSYITEKIFDNTFRLSPNTLKHMLNSRFSELLYETVGEVANLDSTEVLFDMCSGPGIVGVTFAQECYWVAGIEESVDISEDAQHNGATNKVENLTFYQGKPEVVLEHLLNEFSNMTIVPIITMPKDGLENTVVKMLRSSENVDRFVYILVEPKNPLPNFEPFCQRKSKNYKGNPFIPVKAIPVDTAPHTNNYSLVILFEKYSELKWDRIMADNPRPRDKAFFKTIPTATNCEMLQYLCPVEETEKLEYGKYDRSNQQRENDYSRYIEGYGEVRGQLETALAYKQLDEDYYCAVMRAKRDRFRGPHVNDMDSFEGRNLKSRLGNTSGNNTTSDGLGYIKGTYGTRDYDENLSSNSYSAKYRSGNTSGNNTTSDGLGYIKGTYGTRDYDENLSSDSYRLTDYNEHLSRDSYSTKDNHRHLSKGSYGTRDYDEHLNNGSFRGRYFYNSGGSGRNFNKNTDGFIGCDNGSKIIRAKENDWKNVLDALKTFTDNWGDVGKEMSYNNQ